MIPYEYWLGITIWLLGIVVKIVLNIRKLERLLSD